MIYKLTTDARTGALMLSIEQRDGRIVRRAGPVSFNRTNARASVEAVQAAFVTKHGAQGQLRFPQVKPGVKS